MSLKQSIIFLAIVGILGCGQIYSQIRLSPEEADKLVVEKPEPVYPPFAKMMKLQETVKVELNVAESGTVASARFISGNVVFKAAALDAAKRRKYKPCLEAGKAVPFVTTVEFRFSLGIPEDEYERDNRISQKYSTEVDKCRNRVKGEKWLEAETLCKAAIDLAEQFPSGRELEKMGAYQLFGHAMMGQKRYQEALESYTRAREAVTSTITEKNAELAGLYGNMAIANHLMGDLGKARELYRKAETIYQVAYANFGGDDVDEEIKRVRQGYMTSLKRLLEYHLIAAEESGAASEIEEIRKLMKGLP